jgi:hypothetical protein
MVDHGQLEYATARGNDYVGHEQMYRTFVTLTRSAVVVIAIIVILMAIFLTWTQNCATMVGLLASSRPVPGVRLSARAEGSMKIAVAAESDAGEPQTAATLETIRKMVALGADVAVKPAAET